MVEPIHHIAVAAEWNAAISTGVYERSTIGRSLDEVGFIHCSTTEQWPATLERFYAGCDQPLVLLTIDPVRLGGALHVEDGFPHLYGPLPVAAVIRVEPIR